MSAYAETRRHPFRLSPVRLLVSWSGLVDERFASLIPEAGLTARIRLPRFRILQKLFGIPLDSTSGWQTEAQVGALIAESILIALLIGVFYGAGAHAIGLWVLLAVGVHLLVIGHAHGHQITMLGVFCILSAASGLLLTRFPVQVFRLIGVLLKMGFIGQMPISHYVWSFLFRSVPDMQSHA